jgi:hypothetical protein
MIELQMEWASAGIEHFCANAGFVRMLGPLKSVSIGGSSSNGKMGIFVQRDNITK